MLRSLVPNGSIQVREDIVDGLENAPEAFAGMLEGENLDKLVVRMS
jgi:NADPH-dependent curcumin reductase CurA